MILFASSRAELLADGVALLHGLVVAYLAGGTVLIAIGLWRGWEFVRNFLFRYSHLLLLLIVNLFEWANVPCPLTTFEWRLREQGNESSTFIQHYVTEAIHVPVAPSVIARLTFPLLLVVAALYIKAGPRRANETPATEAPPTEPLKPSRFRMLIVLGLLAIMVGSSIKLCDWLCQCFASGCSDETWQCYFHSSFFALAMMLCLFTPGACGLGVGSLRRWQSYDLNCAIVAAIPPLCVAIVYANLDTKPFSGIPVASWLQGSIAQELLLSGFVYARLSELWGTPGESWREAFAWPMIATPILFVLWHWPNVHFLTHGYFAFQCVYVFLGGWWMLNLRRWTGSIWPGAVTHVIVNYLAAAV